jgi:hypothetical protein
MKTKMKPFFIQIFLRNEKGVEKSLRFTIITFLRKKVTNPRREGQTWWER